MSGRKPPAGVPCERGHRMVRFEPMPCDGGHDHRLYSCFLRIGRDGRICGFQKMVPPYGADCDDPAYH